MAFATDQAIENGVATPDSVDNEQSFTDAETRTEKFERLESGRDVYEATDDSGETTRSDSTDEVDIQKLVGSPSVSDLRWLYRFTFASTLVDKPIDDAFKRGFDVTVDPTQSVKSVIERHDYIDKLKRGEIKGRRDSFSLLFKVTNDSTDGLHEAITPQTFNSLEAIKVLTIDDLTDSKPPNFRQQLPAEYRPGRDQSLHDLVEVRKSGMVVSRVSDDPDFGNPIGYLLNRRADNSGESRFVHASRVQHLTWQQNVDGDYYGDGDQQALSDSDGVYRPSHGVHESSDSSEWGALGKWEGDSILLPAYHLLKDIFKASWATSQTLFRYSSPLYALNLPERADAETLEKVRNNFRNMNAKGDAVLPHGFEMKVHGTEGQITPEEYFGPLFSQICATVEMNKSVLFGTQAGTTSGTESDQKSYYNQVNRYRKNRAEAKIREFVEWMNRMDKSAIPNLALSYEIEWPALFEPSSMDKKEILHRAVQSVQGASEYYMITPNEGRDILDDAFEEAGYDVDMSDDLTTEDFDLISELLVAQQGSGELWPTGEESQSQGNPQQQNGGGMSTGQTISGEQPNREGDS